MATIVNTTDLRFKVGGAVIAEATGAELTITTELRDLASKDSGGWRKVAAGIKQAEFTGSALLNFDGTTTTAEDIFDDIIADTEVAVLFQAGSGDIEYSASGYFTQWQQSAEGVSQNGTVNYTLAVNGAVAKATTA